MNISLCSVKYTHPGRGPDRVYPYYIHDQLHTSGIYTGNHYQLPVPSFAWVTDIAICCVYARSVLITKGAL